MEEEDDDSELVEKLKSALLTKLIPVCRALDITSTRELREYGYDELASDMRTHANYTLLPNTWRKIQALVAMESLNSTPLPFTGTPSPIKSSPGVVTGTPVEESIKVLLMNDQRVPDLDALLKTGTAMPVAVLTSRQRVSLEASAAVDDYGKVRLHLACISPISPLHLPISRRTSQRAPPASRRRPPWRRAPRESGPAAPGRYRGD